MPQAPTKPRTTSRVKRAVSWLAVGLALNAAITWSLLLPWISTLQRRTEVRSKAAVWIHEVPGRWKGPIQARTYTSCVATIYYQDGEVYPEPTWKENGTTIQVTLAEGRVGIPFRSLGGWVLIDRDRPFVDPTRTPHGCVELATNPLGIMWLPLTPLWPGFALNTLFYAAIAWGLWQIPLAIRRRRRRAKGRCVRCNYDLSGLPASPPTPCPECGNGGRRGSMVA